MNFLAHIYLSGKNDHLIIGNFIADSIKGKKYLNYPETVQKGILLHRAIDSFTDFHPVVRRSARRLYPKYGHYSPVIVDIFYDHFLASNWVQYSEEPLEEFISDFYVLLERNFSILPLTVQQFFPYMVKENWLLSYSTISGIQRILFQMNKRTQGKSRMDEAVEELREHYIDFESDFASFFPDLQEFSKQKINTLHK